jgi:hypothetical protein
MKYSPLHTCVALLLTLASVSTLAFNAEDAFSLSNKSKRTGVSPHINSKVDLKNKGNIKLPSGSRPAPGRPSGNRPSINRPGGSRPTPNRPNRPDISRPPNRPPNWPNNNRPNRPGNNRPNWPNNNRPNRPGNNRPNWSNNNHPNRPIIINNNNRWYGGGWYGRGYRTPPGWGLATFTTGLVLGAAINSPPPYYSTVYSGRTRYIYSDGVFLEPRGSSYVVVQPPIGAVVTSIPDGCTVISGSTFYDCSGVVYEPFYRGSDIVYRVVRY